MVTEGRDSERVSVSVLPSVGRREEVDGLYKPQSPCGNITAYAELARSSSQVSSFHHHDAPEEHKLARGNSSPMSISSLEGKQIRRRSGKMASSSNGFPKRSRMGQVEDLSTNEAETNDVKEKSQMARAKNGVNGKRVDRRNGKVSVKSKYDLFSLKSGMVTFNSGGGGNNSLGIFGLKPDAFDITKHLDEVTVNELLGGYCKGPSVAKDKGKRIANVNDNLLSSMRKACSILQRKKALKTQSSAEPDDTCNWNVATAPMNVDASNDDSEKLDTCIIDLSSHGKVPPKVLDFLLCRPKDILQRVVLPPPVDLDALLIDAAKPVTHAKDSLDSRGKQVSQRASLANADAMKFSTNRSACHGKWARIDNTAALFEGRSGFLAELECLNYDPKLVPVKSIKPLPSANQAAPCASVSFPVSDFCSSSSATCSRASQLSPENGSNSNREEDAGDSPRSLVAAQTLCNIKQFQHPKMAWNTWTSKPSDKTIKACRSKPDNKFGKIFAKPESAVSSHGLMKSKDTSSIFKKPRFLNNEKGKDLNTEPKGLVNWSIPRSSTQTPSKSYRDTNTNVKSYNTFMMPPPSSRVFDKASNNRQKLR